MQVRLANPACRLLQLPAELLDVDAVLCRFALAEKNDRNVVSIETLQLPVRIHIHFMERCAELRKQRLQGGLRFAAQVAIRARVQRDLERAGVRKAGIFERVHGIGAALRHPLLANGAGMG